MRQYLERLLGSPWLLVAIILLSFFWRAGSIPLYDLDEGAFSEATREMLASGDYLATYMDGRPRYDKPIMIYWLQAISAGLLGVTELAFRLPSLLAATGWIFAIFFFVRQRFDRPTAVAAALMAALALNVSIIARAATADALLNLLLALTFLDVYRYSENPAKGLLYRIYFLMALGFLTKGPVSVVFPLAVSGIFFFSLGRTRDWLRAVFFLPGWVLFLCLALPWYIAVYFEQGPAFFEQFFLHHNLGRFSGVIHGHSGFPGYYFVMLPLVVMPFAGLLLRLLPGMREAWADPLQRFLWIWLILVFTVFSFSNTQLPHYILYGCTPVFILMALHRERLQSRALAYLPLLLLFGILLFLPEILGIARQHATRLYELSLFDEGIRLLDGGYRAAVGLGILTVLGLWFWPGLRPWQGLMLGGVMQALIIVGAFVPLLFQVMQSPTKEAGLLAKENGWPLVAYQTNMPSFSVYRQAITPRRPPEAGEVAFLRVDKMEGLRQNLPNFEFDTLFQKGAVMLVRARERR